MFTCKLEWKEFFKSLNSSLPSQLNELNLVNLSFSIGQFTVT